MRVLRRLHQKAAVNMMEDRSRLQAIVHREAERTARRALAAMAPLLSDGDQVSLGSALDTANDTAQDGVMTTLDHITEAFSSLIRLQRYLPLNRRCYEIFAPQPNSVPHAEQVVTPSNIQIEPDHVITLCLAPGLVEYPSELFLSDDSGPGALFGERNLVKATKEQRREGKVMYTAVVLLKKTESGIHK